jgi:hypothetical protein
VTIEPVATNRPTPRLATSRRCFFRPGGGRRVLVGASRVRFDASGLWVRGAGLGRGPLAFASRARGGEARFRASGTFVAAHLSVLLRAPLFFFDVWIDLVAPALRALLPGLPRKLGGDERPPVPVNLL